DRARLARPVERGAVAAAIRALLEGATGHAVGRRAPRSGRAGRGRAGDVEREALRLERAYRRPYPARAWHRRRVHVTGTTWQRCRAPAVGVDTRYGARRRLRVRDAVLGDRSAALRVA